MKILFFICKTLKIVFINFIFQVISYSLKRVMPVSLEKKKGYKMFRIAIMWQCFWQKLLQSAVIFEIRRYFYFKKKFIRNTWGYCLGTYEYYCDRVYEDDSEFKFNEKIWISDLKRIKGSINRYLYKNVFSFLTNPRKYITTSFIWNSLGYNFSFWYRVFPELLVEIKTIALEVFFSFYSGHNPDIFYKKMGVTKPTIVAPSEVKPDTKFSDFIIDPVDVKNEDKTSDKIK